MVSMTKQVGLTSTSSCIFHGYNEDIHVAVIRISSYFPSTFSTLFANTESKLIWTYVGASEKIMRPNVTFLVMPFRLSCREYKICLVCVCVCAEVLKRRSCQSCRTWHVTSWHQVMLQRDVMTSFDSLAKNTDKERARQACNSQVFSLSTAKRGR